MPTDAPAGFVAIGRVVKPHGVRGEFGVRSDAESPALFDRGATLYLTRDTARPRPLSIRSWRPHKGLVLVRAKGVDDRDAAEALRGMTVLVREADLPPPPPGQHYLYRLMGCRVVLGDGTAVGELRAFFETALQETWVIINEAGTEILLPAVEAFIQDVDLDKGVITVDPPEGLLDLYLDPGGQGESA